MAQRMIDKKKPKYAGMTVDEIQYQWKEKAVLSSMEGTELHVLCERWPDKGRWGWLPKTYRLLKMGKQIIGLNTVLTVVAGSNPAPSNQYEEEKRTDRIAGLTHPRASRQSFPRNPQKEK